MKKKCCCVKIITSTITTRHAYRGFKFLLFDILIWPFNEVQMYPQHMGNKSCINKSCVPASIILKQMTSLFNTSIQTSIWLLSVTYSLLFEVLWRHNTWVKGPPDWSIWLVGKYLYLYMAYSPPVFNLCLVWKTICCILFFFEVNIVSLFFLLLACCRNFNIKKYSLFFF